MTLTFFGNFANKTTVIIAMFKFLGNIPRLPALLLVSLVGFFSMNVCGQSYAASVDSVDRFVQERNWSGAERMLLNALKKEPANPNNYLLLSNLGTVHRNMGRLKEALADYTNALSITPNAVTILHNRASLYLEMDSVEKALVDYERIMRLDETDVDSRYYHGMIALQYGKMDEAKQDFDDVLKLDPHSLDAQRGLALWNKLQNRKEEAIKLYSQIIEKENRLSNYLGRAECYLDLNKTVEAEADLQEAQKLDPSEPMIYVYRARLAELQFRYDDAADYAKKAQELGAEPELVEKFFKKRDL